MKLTLRLLPGELAILRLPPDAATPPWVSLLSGPLLSVTHTAQELSIICPSAVVPAETACEAGWRAFTVEGKLEFAAVGILAGILNPLAQAGVNILSISTFDTDYVLVPGARLQAAAAVLRRSFQLIE